MDNLTRKTKIKEILSANHPVQKGTKLRYKGEIKLFDVYQIPLDFVAYNVENGRIGSLVKSYKVEHGELNVNNKKDSQQIAEFLFSSSEERNKKTLQDLAVNGQMEPGIITMDGIIVDGNRRASLLRRIQESNQFDQATKDKSSYFLARILPEDADEAEILRLETSFQMGTDSKVDYNPIEKYLHIKDMRDKHFTLEQIAEYMGLNSVNEVRVNLEIMDLIDQYLETYEYNGIYTRLPRGCEDDFLKLNTALKKVNSGKISWVQENEKDEVANDLRLICFDFIRLEKKGDFDYRAIASTSNNNFLTDEKTWKVFVDAYYKATEDVEEESVEDVLAKATTMEDSKRLLNQRDNAWKKNVQDELMEAYTDSKNTIENKKEKDKPLALLKKALNALTEIDDQSIYEATNKNELSYKIKELTNRLNEIKEAL